MDFLCKGRKIPGELKLMKYRLHLRIGAEVLKTQLLQPLPGIRNVGPQLLRLMAVASDGKDCTAQFPIQAENLFRWGQIVQAVAVRRGIDFDSLSRLR